MRLPKELQLRVVDEDIVNSPVTAVETSDAPMVIDSSEQRASNGSITSVDAVAMRDKKRGRKPKGSNVGLGLNPSQK